jgi:hypothetical protein
MSATPIDIETRYIQSIVAATVTNTLKQMGVIKVWLSTNECKKLYGMEFRRMAEAGMIRPTIQGSRKVYNREEIEAAMAASLKQARLMVRK